MFLPVRHRMISSVDKDEDGNYYRLMARVNWSTRDYLFYVAYDTFGLTQIGQKLFQESVESYVYSVLGAQAQTRWSIVGAGAKSSQSFTRSWRTSLCKVTRRLSLGI